MTEAVDTSTTGKHLPALDGLRGAAVLLVMAFHLWGNYFSYGSRAARVAVTGWVGVDMFFALSGFLLTGILYDSLGSSHFFRNFYARRSLRIFPLYYLYLFATLLVGLVLGVHFYPRYFLFFFYLDNLSKLAWYRSGVLESSAEWVTVSHFWSLAVEEHFYIVWPALVWLLRTRRRIATAAALLAVLSLAIRVYAHASGITTRYPILPYIWTPTRVDTILIGSVLGMLVRTRFRAACLRWSPVVAGVGIALTVAYSAFHMLDMLIDPVVTTVGFTVVAVWSTALIGWVLRSGSGAERLFSNGLLCFFGRYSYGVYVFHLLVAYLLVVRRPFWLLPVVHSHVGAIMLSRLLVFPVSAAVAVVSYRCFEGPVLRLKRFFPAAVIGLSCTGLWRDFAGCFGAANKQQVSPLQPQVRGFRSK